MASDEQDHAMHVVQGRRGQRSGAVASALQSSSADGGFGCESFFAHKLAALWLTRRQRCSCSCQEFCCRCARPPCGKTQYEPEWCTCTPAASTPPCANPLPAVAACQLPYAHRHPPPALPTLRPGATTVKGKHAGRCHALNICTRVRCDEACAEHGLLSAGP